MYHELRKKSNSLRNREEAARWLEECDDRLLTLSENLQKASVWSKRRTVAQIIDLKCLRVTVKRKFEEKSDGAGGASDEETGIFWQDLESAFACRLSTGMVVNFLHVDPHDFLKDSFLLISERVVSAIQRFRTVKVNTEFHAEFVKCDDEADIKSFYTKNRALDETSSLEEWYREHVSAPILRKLEEFQERDSGWTLSRIENICININKLVPLSAGCCIDLPAYIKNKKAVINIKTSDYACFAWSVVAYLHPRERNVSRVSSYPHYLEVLNVTNIKFPTALKEITCFEEDNNISVNVFMYDESAENKKYIVPIRLAGKKMSRHVNLLYIKNEHHAHYMYIKNLSRLVNKELSANGHVKHICCRCLNYCPSAEALLSHEEYCADVNETRIIMPNEHDETEKWMRFKNYKNKELVPLVVYADLECLLVSNKDDEEEEEEDIDSDRMDKKKKKKTSMYQTHVPYSVGYYVENSADPNGSRYASHRGSDCLQWFAKKMHSLAQEVAYTIHNIQPMNEMTTAQTSTHLNESNCHICEEPFSLDDQRVRDHCHITGEYRGPAHNKCNLNYKFDYMIPIIFHNLSMYDGHFIIKAVAEAFDGNIKVLALNKEQYISFTKFDEECRIQLRFIDSFKFLSSSLDKLSSYLKKDELTIFKSEFRDLPDKQVELLMRKGIFPYDYVDSFDKLENETQLPDKKYFFNQLNDCDISDDDYNFARSIWNMFNIQNLGEYSDLYLKTDVLLLADVFENFRKQCMSNYGLDPAHYFTLPGFTWDAMLKCTKIEFELLTDIDMLMMIEKGIRGGLCQCSHRYARANNKYMESFDENEPSTYLMYFDVNNLYGWAMRQYLPTHGFQWVNEIDESDVLNTADDSSTGYVLEVDLSYPEDLHDSHSDLPFCPSRDKPPGNKQSKLIASLHHKTRYVIHYRTLKQCVKNGLRLTRIHRCISFYQSAWLQPYIDLNTRLRMDAANDFEKNLFKLMNNAVFGKTMENVRKHVDVRLVSRWEGRGGAKRLLSMPNFHSRTIFGENFCAIQMKRLNIKFNKPIYIGMSILDISKTCLYDFHYDYMKRNFKDQFKLLYTDTDSLIYSIECNDVYENMRENLSFFDTSDYPLENAYGLPRANKKVPGLMKDENCGRIMREFVGLRAKMYATRTEGSEDVKKSKGVKRCVVERKILFDDYLHCLRSGDQIVKQQNLLMSRQHNVFSVSQSKVALNPYDDKRYLLPNSFGTLPWGHYNIEM